MPQKALIDKFYAEIFATCEQPDCDGYFECSEEPKVPFEEWALRAANEAENLGWRIGVDKRLFCPNCSKNVTPLSDDSQISDARKDVATIAQSLLSQNISFLEGIRQLNSLRFEVSIKDNDIDFQIFVVIDSETDHMPAKETRLMSSKSWLVKCDADLDVIRKFYSLDVSKSCENLIKRFSC
jgi:hypothetical protein